VEDQHVSREVHPRVLIKAIQDNLGITKKEIAERTGISYGTLNRYTRSTAPIGRPRRSSIERLKNLYEASLRRFGRSAEAGHPGADYKRLLLKRSAGFEGIERDSSFGAVGVDPLDLKGMRREPFARFLRRLAFYAHEDLRLFAASGFRDRTRIHQTRELVGDMYVSLLNDLGDATFAARSARPTEQTHPAV
jgi:transcriptional regulator with XRE-family HTH domain